MLMSYDQTAPIIRFLIRESFSVESAGDVETAGGVMHAARVLAVRFRIEPDDLDEMIAQVARD